MDLHLYIYEEVMEGLENEIQNQIKEYPEAENIYVHINSPGGGVYTGWTVGNILSMQSKPTIALIEGFCASIATYIALSCDRVEMADTAQFMIHNASMYLGGDKNQFKEAVRQLDKIDQDLISKYVKKTGLPPNEIAEMMDKETFLNTEETIRLGFADKKMQPLKAVAKFDFKQVKMNDEQKGILAQIKDLVLGVKNESQEEKPNNMAITLEDGTMIFVYSEDGEFEGKSVVMADEDGEPTETPAPNGTHALDDGRSITVEDGVITSVKEDDPEDMDEEKEEMKKKIETMEEEMKNLQNQLQTKNEETTKVLNEVLEQVQNLSNVTVGTSFKVDKPKVSPENKNVNSNQPTGQVNQMDGLLAKIKQTWQ